MPYPSVNQAMTCLTDDPNRAHSVYGSSGGPRIASFWSRGPGRQPAGQRRLGGFGMVYSGMDGCGKVGGGKFGIVVGVVSGGGPTVVGVVSGGGPTMVGV